MKARIFALFLILLFSPPILNAQLFNSLADFGIKFKKRLFQIMKQPLIFG
jgi:hypothetical protein